MSIERFKHIHCHFQTVFMGWYSRSQKFSVLNQRIESFDKDCAFVSFRVQYYWACKWGPTYMYWEMLEIEASPLTKYQY